MQWSSSQYREAKRSAVENLAILFERHGENPHLSFAYWLSQFILLWTLLFLGEWGEALAEIRAGISMAEKNGITIGVRHSAFIRRGCISTQWTLSAS